MLIINPRYKGRFSERAVTLVKSGTRVGMMWISEERKVHCHVCEKDFTPPEIDPQYGDAWGECTHCKTPFVFAIVKGGK